MTVDELQVLITANTTELKKELAKTNSAIASVQKQASTSSTAMTKAFKLLKTGIVALGIGKLIKSIFSNMDDAISRVDTLNNYSKVMGNLGVSTEDADASINRLSDKLTGLPTTLDDAVASVQRFTASNGNVKASTEMFLALNNALLGSGASTEAQASAMEQITQAYSKGKPDMMEWRNMLSTMPAQLKQIGLSLGYADVNSFGEDLRSGKVSMDDFMVAVTKLNKEGVDGFASFEEQAGASTNGIKTSITNMKTAMTRGLAEIMNAIGQSNIAGFFNGITKAINKVVPYITAFVKVCISAVSYITSLFGGSTKKKVDSTSDAVSSLGSSASSTASDIDDTTDSAESLNKELGKLAGFDEMNVLTDSSSSSDSDDSSSSSGADVSGIDLSEWDTSLTDTSSKADEIAEKMKNTFKDLADYINGLGFDGIIEHVKSIGDSIKNIFTDSNVQSSAQNWATTLINTLGSVTSNIARIGFNIADGLLGSIDTYLSSNSGRIKDFIVGMFDISGRNLGITDKLVSALSEISSVFTGDVAEQIGADIIGMFANPFMSLTETFTQFGTDMYDLLVTPITDNIDLIKTTFENVLEPVQVVFDTLNDAFTTFGDTIASIYDEHLSPFFESLKTGLSDTFKKFLEVYNTYVVPFISNCANKFSEIWTNYLKPLWDNVAEFIGNVVDLITWLWETVLKPVIDWIVQNIIPIIVPILNQIANVVSTVIKLILNAINTVLGVLNGVITFLKGVFTGDWNTAWSGIQKIFSSIWNGIKNVVSTVINYIKETVINAFNLIKARISAIMSAISGVISSVWNGILSAIKNVINCIIGALNTMIKGINKLSFDVPDWVPVIGGKRWGFNIPTIPKLAQGGIVDKPTYAMIGEAGKEAVMPLERNTGWIDKLADKLASKIGNAGGSPIQLVVKIGEDTILDKFIEGINNKNFETNGEVFSL